MKSQNNIKPKNNEKDKKSKINIDDIDSLEGVKEVDKKSDISKNLYRVLRSKSSSRNPVQVTVEKLYQIENVEGFKNYSESLKKNGGGEAWLFYACTKDMISEVLGGKKLISYSEFFPATLGSKAIYLFESPSQAARVAFRFGTEKEGLLLSCRLNLGKIFKTTKGNPRADKAPDGYDTVFARKGTNLGDGAIDSDLYAVFDPKRVLMRYAIHISR